VPTIMGTARKGPALPESIRQRIVKIEHHRSGLRRGSNSWLDDCDAILVVGTPRVPPAVIRTRLIQHGLTAAAARDGEWGRDYWSGVTARSRPRSGTTWQWTVTRWLMSFGRPTRGAKRPVLVPFWVPPPM
jgi:hypothetical protein